VLLHAAQRRPDVVLFAHSLFGPFDGEIVVAGISLHPSLVIIGAAAEDLFVHHRDAENLMEEVDHLLGPRKTAEVAVDDDTVEAVVYQNKQAVEQLCEQLHRSPPGIVCRNKIIGQAPGGVNSAGAFEGFRKGKKGIPKGKKP
jgi:hypothetical protein